MKAAIPLLLCRRDTALYKGSFPLCESLPPPHTTPENHIFIQRRYPPRRTCSPRSPIILQAGTGKPSVQGSGIRPACPLQRSGICGILTNRIQRKCHRIPLHRLGKVQNFSRSVWICRPVLKPVFPERTTSQRSLYNPAVLAVPRTTFSDRCDRGKPATTGWSVTESVQAFHPGPGGPIAVSHGQEMEAQKCLL